MTQVRAPILEACADESIKVKAEPEEKRSLWSRLFKKNQNAQKDKLIAEKILKSTEWTLKKMPLMLMNLPEN